MLPEWFRDQNGISHYLAKTNANFERYYRAQKACGSEEELQRCFAAMRRELPQGFRMDASLGPAKRNQLRRILSGLREEGFPLRRLPWGDGDVWQVRGTSRWNLLEDGSLSRLHRFIAGQDDLGHISRQELVSMVPVLLLDVRPHHRVLDVCASPGSKTKQVLSRMHELGGPLPSGIVVANELDVARCDKLCSNAGKANSPCLVVVNHDGYRFPDLFLDSNEKKLKFDRIVCDVPCSGDGTVRKNPTVWSGWTPGAGNSRHFVQYNVAERAVEMLAVGGTIAYSSCSMNPVENEAVVGRLLKVSRGALELVDVAGRLPGLESATGFTRWTVMDSEMNAYGSFGEVPDRARSSQIHEGMFSSQYEEFRLERCVRLLPHHNDCGGFFVAVMRKVRGLPWEEMEEAAGDESLMSTRLKRSARGELEKFLDRKAHKRPRVALPNRPKPCRELWNGRGSFRFFDGEDGEVLGKDLRFYGFPPELRDPSIYFATSESAKRVRLANGIVRKVIECNVDGKAVNFVKAGAKCFTRNGMSFNSVERVLARESRLVALMGPERTVEVEREDMRALLGCAANKSLPFAGFTERAKKRLGEVSKEAVGPAKIVCGGGGDLELLAHLGFEKVVPMASESMRYHGELVLADNESK